MKYLFPSSFFFMFFMGAGTFICYSSMNIFLVWCGLEMNLMSFIPLMIQFKNLGEIEAAVKYFLVQSFGSCLIVWGFIGSFFKILALTGCNVMDCIFITSGLFLKLGLFPFYFWVPSVMVSMSWFSCMLIATFQKLAPLSVFLSGYSRVGFLYETKTSFSLVWTVMEAWPNYTLFLGVIFAGLLGMNQVNVKGLMAYSSISHMSWIVISGLHSQSISLCYTLVYMISNVTVFMILMTINFYQMSSLKSNCYFSEANLVLLVFGLLTLSGIPPFLGFFPKFLVLKSLYIGFGASMNIFLIFLLLGLGVGSCLSLYYYLSLVLNVCINLPEWSGSFMFNSVVSKMIMILVVLNVVGILVFFVLIL